MVDIPKDYFKNLSCYEEFQIKCTLIGEKPSSELVLKNLQYSDPYFWFTAGGKVCMIDKTGALVEDAKVYDSIWCTDLELDSLEGCPNEVRDGFACDRNNLVSLKGCPSKIGGSFSCSNNNLVTLEGFPEEIGNNFYSYGNNLTSLEGCHVEKMFGTFECSNNSLVSLKGCPDVIGFNFDCSNNKLVSLEGGPSKVYNNLICDNNPLKTLKGAPSQAWGSLNFQYTNLTQRQIDAYKEFLRHPTPDLIDETGHYCPKDE